MITTLAFATVAVVLAIVLVVAYHLIGIFVALKRSGDHLEALAGGLIAIRENTQDTRRVRERIYSANTQQI